MMQGKALFVQFVTLTRIPLALLFAVVMERSGTSMEGIPSGVLLLLLIEVSDGLDGFLARRLKVTSEFGALFDPYADSFSRLLVYWALARRGTGWEILPLVMAWRDITVAYCRMLLLRAGKKAGARWSGKVKAVCQGLGAFALLLIPLLGEGRQASAAWAVSALVLSVTVWSISDYVRDAAAATGDDLSSKEH